MTFVPCARPSLRWPAFLLLLLAVRTAPAVEPAVLAEQDRRIAVVESVAPTVVAIFASDAKGGGSGVLVSPDGYTVTNYHVVETLGPFMKCGLNDGRLYDAVLVGLDPTGDVALIKLLGREDFPHATIGDSDNVQVGHWAYAMGNPFLLATDFQPTVSYGLVSGVHRYQYPAGTILEYTDCIQVDASINPGNSGGPLFDDHGLLIGINGRASFEKRGRVNVGAGYAISINQVMNFLDHLKSGRIVDHATLGATVREDFDGTLTISDILENSEAFRRGLRIGDELVSFAGRPMRSVNQFKNVLGIYPKGWRVPLVYRRDGQKHEALVRLRGVHRASEFTTPAEESKPEHPPEGPRPPEAPKPAAPAEYQHLYEARAGYANWYFNQQHRDRLMKAVRALGDFSETRGRWELQGRTADGQPVNFKLNNEAVASTIGDAPALQLTNQPFTDLPAGTGGLLASLFHYRQLLLDPEGYFTEFYYLGSEPFGETGDRADILITTRGTVETRWAFHRETGELLGWETTLEEDTDECAVRVESWQTVAGRRWPARLTITHSGTPVLDVTFDQIQAVATAPAK